MDIKVDESLKHLDKIFDLDWRNDVEFVTASKDTSIRLWKIGEKAPLREFFGHSVIFPI